MRSSILAETTTSWAAAGVTGRWRTLLTEGGAVWAKTVLAAPGDCWRGAAAVELRHEPPESFSRPGLMSSMDGPAPEAEVGHGNPGA